MIVLNISGLHLDNLQINTCEFSNFAANAMAVAQAANLAEISTCIYVKVRVMFTFGQARVLDLEVEKEKKSFFDIAIISDFSIPMQRHIMD